MSKILKPYTIIPANLYVARDADRQIENIIGDMGRPGYVLVSRQMGKTNLLLNAKRRLESPDDFFIYIDLSNRFDTAKACFENIIDSALEFGGDKFQSVQEVIIARRRELIRTPPHKQHLNELRLLLKCLTGRIVIILDEVDALTEKSYSDQIFAQIRSIYFSRVNFPELERLTYILSGVVEPADLIKDLNISPFNIGQKIFLSDFSEQEFAGFLDSSGLKIDELLKDRIFYWTSGNPRMTWDLCSEVENYIIERKPVDTGVIDKIVANLYLTSYDKPPVDGIRETIRQNPEIRHAVIAVNEQRGNDLNDTLKYKLYLAGITSYKDNGIEIKNEIIKRSLSTEWILSLQKETESVYLTSDSHRSGRYDPDGGGEKKIPGQEFGSDSYPEVGRGFETLLDSMVAAEVGSFDREILRSQGFDRAKVNYGDPEALLKGFDTLYTVFINDIQVIVNKKNRLISKIEEHRIKSQETLIRKLELQTGFLEKEADNKTSALTENRSKRQNDLETILKNTSEIRSARIPLLEKANETLYAQIRKTELEYFPPKFKWFEFFPVVVSCLGLLIFLFMLYSSGAYTLLFSVADAKAAATEGLNVPGTQVFNPDAIEMAFHQSISAFLFIALFAFIPLSFAVIDNFASGKLMTWFSLIFGILVLNIITAYKVAESFYGANNIVKSGTVPWTPVMVFSDTNFYLFFTFSSFGLMLFKISFKKLMRIFQERIPDPSIVRNQLMVKQLREEMGENTEKIMTLKESAAEFEKNTIQIRKDIEQFDLEISKTHELLNNDLQKKKNEQLSDQYTVEKIAAIYTMNIQSDNLPVSVESVKDRINVFLEGWNEFLAKEFSATDASARSADASEAARLWQAARFGEIGLTEVQDNKP